MKTPASKSRARKSLRGEPPGLDAPFPVVAIGASAGGLEAYTEFFRALPANTGMAFVLVLHLDPTHDSMLAEILIKTTRIPVEQAVPGVRVKPNWVYVIPPNAFMAIREGALVMTPRSRGSTQHLAVNFFMRSLAEERKSSAIGIVLSGTGSDGTSGVEDIKAEGGITFAQEPESARYDGMPRSAIDSGCIDFVLPLKEIARELARIKDYPYVLLQERAGAEAGTELGESVAPAAPDDKHFSSILDQLRRRSGTDFSQYRPSTIYRRALRRMVILKQDTLGKYAKYMKENPEESEKLFDDVLIPVTSFFRDFETFEALKAEVYPAIVNDKANKGAIRMWAPGCSTGEETYSLAMTLLEFLGDRAPSFQVQIFGTDLNEKGIQKARAGLYRESIAEEISPDRIARFFVKVEGGYRVNKAVRDMCVFAQQNLATDPPFSQMNLVACRNLLIYIQPVLQKKIMPILHYALKPSGFLILGGSESVSAFPDLFSTVDKKHKIYGKKAIASRLHYDFVQNYYPAHPAGMRPDTSGEETKPVPPAREQWDVQAEADRVVLKHHAPVGVVVNEAMEVVQFRGRTSPFLEQSAGKPSLNVLKLARNGLALELRALIAAAEKKDAPVHKNDVRFDNNGHSRTLDLSVTPLGEPDATGKGERQKTPGKYRFFLILFNDVTPKVGPAPQPDRSPKGKERAAGSLDRKEIKRLRQEVTGTQDALRSAIESEDALKEEFQSANEEILSANEELQSTNEELETSKEELQSANEELHTLNAELRNKNSELHDLSNDISNFLNSTRIPVVMLDRSLRIRRLTPTADKLLKVRPSDIGRSLADLRANIEAPELEHWAREVLDSLQPMDHEVRDAHGHWGCLCILPYRTEDNKIDGVVLALQDIDALKAAGEQLRKSSEFLRGIIDTVREPLLVLDHELRVVSTNKPFLSTFEVSEAETVKQFVYDLGNGQWNIPKLRALLERVLSNNEEVTDFELEHDFETIGSRAMVLNARFLHPTNDGAAMILLAIDDVTARNRATQALRTSEERFRAFVEASSDAVYRMSADWSEMLELQGKQFIVDTKKPSTSWLDTYIHPSDQARVTATIHEAIRTRSTFELEHRLLRVDGTLGWTLSRAIPILDAEGEIVEWFGTATDVTERRVANERSLALRADLEQQWRIHHTTLSSITDFTYTVDRQGRFLYANQPLLNLWGMKLEEAVGKTFFELPYSNELAAKFQQQMEQVFTTGRKVADETEYTSPTGAAAYQEYFFNPIFDAEGNVELIAGSTHDITERKQAEAALIKSERLAAAGRLAATLAHEINNPLQAVTNLLMLLGQSTSLSEEEEDYAKMAAEELGRVTHLTQQSLGFYRESTAPTAVNLEEMIESVLNLYAKRIRRKKIKVKKQYLSDGVAITAHPGEIRQVFSTLLMNAMEAVSEGGSFSLRVSKSAAWNQDSSSRGIRITLADNGCGIRAAHAARIFEAFFTTKGEYGTGLGLWVAQGIVHRLGGSIKMRSRVHPETGGTSFSIFLPIETSK